VIPSSIPTVAVVSRVAVAGFLSSGEREKKEDWQGGLQDVKGVNYPRAFKVLRCITLLHSYKSLLQVYKQHPWAGPISGIAPLAARMLGNLLCMNRISLLLGTFVICVLWSESRSSRKPFKGNNQEFLCAVRAEIPTTKNFKNLRRETMGSPALGQGSNCKLCFVVSDAPNT
jgi:hypothetical protein